MIYKKACLVAGFFVIIIFLCPIPFRYAYSAFLYKRYIVRYDRGWDILCEPYVVKKNDWVFKLFRQKGEIAHGDFPEFLQVFKRLNPQVHDINRIRPGQHIMIPLKRMSQENLVEPSANIVTIPFVTISNQDKARDAPSTPYRVRAGDSVSMLIARKYGAYGTRSYREGIRWFKLTNPNIEDLDRIYTGQVIVLPDMNTATGTWYQTPTRRVSDNDSAAKLGLLTPNSKENPRPFVAEISQDKPKPPLLTVASALDATLYDKGNYFFPRRGEEDFKLDLVRFPIIELNNGKRLFFFRDDAHHESVLDAVKSHWKDVNIVRITPSWSVEQVFQTVFEQMDKNQLKDRLLFSDNGVDVEVRGKWIVAGWDDAGKTVRHVCITFIDEPGERTPPSIRRYLDQNNIVMKEVITDDNAAATKHPQPRHHRLPPEVVTIYPSDRQTFVKQLIAAVGYQYSPDVTITFPYAGAQIKAISNLITRPDGGTFLVDFGDLYGDAARAIEDTGLGIVQINMKDNLPTIVQKILNLIGVPFSSKPIFLAAHRHAAHNTLLTIPGFLVDVSAEAKVLFSLSPLHHGVVRFLNDEGVKVVLISARKKSN